MEKLNIDEAIRCWNDPKVTFTSTYICWREHGRGYKPDFKPIKIENGIQVDMDSEGFHIDEISIDDFETENDRNEFISMVEDEIGFMESLVGELTERINKKVLERVTKIFLYGSK